MTVTLLKNDGPSDKPNESKSVGCLVTGKVSAEVDGQVVISSGGQLSWQCFVPFSITGIWRKEFMLKIVKNC